MPSCGLEWSGRRQQQCYVPCYLSAGKGGAQAPRRGLIFQRRIVLGRVVVQLEEATAIVCAPS